MAPHANQGVFAQEIGMAWDAAVTLYDRNPIAVTDVAARVRRPLRAPATSD
ncbi:hypothetical protein PS682_05323 [Pseudomonas fluorescens]|jgi:hypothetical protein|nr:hypothetical protein PS682_05323 [Pseudomonas fluorescens]